MNRTAFVPTLVTLLAASSLLCILAVFVLCVPSTAEAVIGRASVDGTEIDKQFIATAPDSITWDVAVDAEHLYWTWSDDYEGSPATAWIGRAHLDGTAVEPKFISNVGPGGLAVSAGYLYWANPGVHTIGRATVDGSGVNRTFITSIGERAYDVEADANHVYWAWDSETTPPGGPRFGWVGRANVDGSGADPSLIGPISFGSGSGLALDAAHVYFTGGLTVYRADLDGNGGPACPSPVDECAPGVVENAPAWDFASDGQYLFGGLGDYPIKGRPSFGIARIPLDGSVFSRAFITTDMLPIQIAIGSGQLYWTASDSASPGAADTVITKAPRRRTRHRSATFRFSSGPPDATFECRLDHKPSRPCESPKSFRHLSRGRHTFRVSAIDSAGIMDQSPAVFRFRVRR